MTYKQLIKRLKTKETRLGKILKIWVAGFLLLCSAIGAANDYLVLFPQMTEFIPLWVKSTIAIAGLISFVAGKLTVKKDEQEEGTDKGNN